MWLLCDAGQWRKVIFDVKITSTDKMNDAFKEKDDKYRTWATRETREQKVSKAVMVPLMMVGCGKLAEAKIEITLVEHSGRKSHFIGLWNLDGDDKNVPVRIMKGALECPMKSTFLFVSSEPAPHLIEEGQPKNAGAQPPHCFSASVPDEGGAAGVRQNSGISEFRYPFSGHVPGLSRVPSFHITLVLSINTRNLFDTTMVSHFKNKCSLFHASIDVANSPED